MSSDHSLSITSRWVAGILFAGGVIWSVPAVYLIFEAGQKMTRFGATAFWIVGLAIWVGWGFVAFARVREKIARAIGMGSFLFHLGVFVVTFLVLIVSSASTSMQATWWWIIPGWWLVAAVGSLVGYTTGKRTHTRDE